MRHIFPTRNTSFIRLIRIQTQAQKLKSPLCYFQKQHNSLIAGLRATNEQPMEHLDIDEKSKENSVERDSDGESKEGEARHR